MINNNMTDGRNIISGKVIFDDNHRIVSGDEDFYRFVSPVIRKITDVIHQIDIDDFFDVLSDLSTYSVNTMVMRMRRFDNSYRWVIAMLKFVNVTEDSRRVYIEMDISDIINLHNHYLALTNVFNKEQAHITFDELGSIDDMLDRAKLFNESHRDNQLNFGLIEIDNYDAIVQKYGKDSGEEIRNNLVAQIYDSVGDAALISKDDQGRVGFYIVDMGIEVNVRSFVEAVRKQLLWRYISTNKDLSVKFTIGISEYPRNGRDIDTVIAKMYKAHELAVSKGRGRYIIFKEELHGDL